MTLPDDVSDVTLCNALFARLCQQNDVLVRYNVRAEALLGKSGSCCWERYAPAESVDPWPRVPRDVWRNFWLPCLKKWRNEFGGRRYQLSQSAWEHLVSNGMSKVDPLKEYLEDVASQYTWRNREEAENTIYELLLVPFHVQGQNNVLMAQGASQHILLGAISSMFKRPNQKEHLIWRGTPVLAGGDLGTAASLSALARELLPPHLAYLYTDQCKVTNALATNYRVTRGCMFAHLKSPIFGSKKIWDNYTWLENEWGLGGHFAGNRMVQYEKTYIILATCHARPPLDDLHFSHWGDRWFVVWLGDCSAHMGDWLSLHRDRLWSAAWYLFQNGIDSAAWWRSRLEQGVVQARRDSVLSL